jgi:RNA polymerase sigma-70 factor (ECF subfamily)
MSKETLDQRLSRIQTYWTVVCRAHEGSPETVQMAQKQLLERYGKAVNRYLLGALRDQEAAAEVGQEFALRFLQGGLQGADRERGRFRDYVKGALFRMVADYHRRLRRQLPQLPVDAGEPPSPDEGPSESERAFVESWREELLDRAWKALARWQEESGQPYYTVLRFRAEHLDLRSAQMAEQLARPLGKAVSAAWVRQNLHRARDKFADLLIEEVAQTLNQPTGAEVEQELIDLGLLEYCQPALERYRRKG